MEPRTGTSAHSPKLTLLTPPAPRTQPNRLKTPTQATPQPRRPRPELEQPRAGPRSAVPSSTRTQRLTSLLLKLQPWRAQPYRITGAVWPTRSVSPLSLNSRSLPPPRTLIGSTAHRRRMFLPPSDNSRRRRAHKASPGKATLPCTREHTPSSLLQSLDQELTSHAAAPADIATTTCACVLAPGCHTPFSFADRQRRFLQ